MKLIEKILMEARLDELFNNVIPYKFKLSKVNKNKYISKFIDCKGNKIKITFLGFQSVEFDFDEMPLDFPESLMTFDLSFEINGDQINGGTNYSLKEYSKLLFTVVSAGQQFLDTVRPWKLIFTGNDDRKVSIYKRISKIFNHPDYIVSGDRVVTFERKDGRDESNKWELEKKVPTKVQLTELFDLNGTFRYDPNEIVTGSIEFKDNYDGTVTVEILKFNREEYEVVEIAFAYNGNYSGSAWLKDFGNYIKIINTVASIVKEYVQHEKPNEVNISAYKNESFPKDQERKKNIYKYMVDKFASDWYSIDVKLMAYGYEIIMKRKKGLY